MKTRVSLKYFVNYCLWKDFFDSKSLQLPSNLISLKTVVALRLFTLFNLNLTQLAKRGKKWPYLVTDFAIFSLRSTFGS